MSICTSSKKQDVNNGREVILEKSSGVSLITGSRKILRGWRLLQFVTGEDINQRVMARHRLLPRRIDLLAPYKFNVDPDGTVKRGGSKMELLCCLFFPALANIWDRITGQGSAEWTRSLPAWIFRVGMRDLIGHFITTAVMKTFLASFCHTFVTTLPLKNNFLIISDWKRLQRPENALKVAKSATFLHLGAWDDYLPR